MEIIAVAVLDATNTDITNLYMYVYSSKLVTIYGYTHICGPSYFLIVFTGD